MADRRFRSAVIERTIAEMRTAVKSPELALIFENCFPNTLDTTVFPGSFQGKPDTYVITGDIDAMWLRDPPRRCGRILHSPGKIPPCRNCSKA